MSTKRETEESRDGRPRVWVDRQEVGYSWRLHPASPPNCMRTLGEALIAGLAECDYHAAVIIFGGGAPDGIERMKR